MSLARAERKLTSRGHERRQELLRVAIDKFAEQGYHPTSVADIVGEVGVGKGVFYWYFTSKEDLLREILKDALLELRRHQQAAICDEPNPLRRIELGVRATLDWLAEHPEVQRLVDFARTEDTFADELRRGREISTEDAVRHLTEAMGQGLIKQGDARTMAIAIRGITDEISRTATDTDSPPPVEAVIRMTVHGLTGGAS
ncbi:MAG: TetR/AcrR family transcriptional regulator [Acidimicrobiales bacterium]|nr:TetR/AcrR family transcriptional regulator [Acidimicrobiales bacterium]